MSKHMQKIICLWTQGPAQWIASLYLPKLKSDFNKEILSYLRHWRLSYVKWKTTMDTCQNDLQQNQIILLCWQDASKSQKKKALVLDINLVWFMFLL